jgi:hypothetical protein
MRSPGAPYSPRLGSVAGHRRTGLVGVGRHGAFQQQVVHTRSTIRPGTAT